MFNLNDRAFSYLIILVIFAAIVKSDTTEIQPYKPSLNQFH